MLCGRTLATDANAFYILWRDSAGTASLRPSEVSGRAELGVVQTPAWIFPPLCRIAQGRHSGPEPAVSSWAL